MLRQRVSVRCLASCFPHNHDIKRVPIFSKIRGDDTLKHSPNPCSLCRFRSRFFWYHNRNTRGARNPLVYRNEPPRVTPPYSAFQDTPDILRRDAAETFWNHFCLTETARRHRPFARRRASVARPPAPRCRRKKPWVLARFRRLITVTRILDFSLSCASFSRGA